MHVSLRVAAGVAGPASCSGRCGHVVPLTFHIVLLRAAQAKGPQATEPTPHDLPGAPEAAPYRSSCARTTRRMRVRHGSHASARKAAVARPCTTSSGSPAAKAAATAAGVTGLT